jgi:hypothetical protein
MLTKPTLFTPPTFSLGTLIKRAVFDSVRTAALHYSSSTQFSLPPVVCRLISLLLSIGPKTHKIICDWLMQGSQIHLNQMPAPVHEPTPSSEGSQAAHFDPKALIRNICESNKFFAELCKYLAAENRDIERSLRTILHSVVSESASLSALLRFNTAHLYLPIYPS